MHELKILHTDRACACMHAAQQIKMEAMYYLHVVVVFLCIIPWQPKLFIQLLAFSIHSCTDL